MIDIKQHQKGFDRDYYFGHRRDGFDGNTYKFDHPEQQYQLKVKHGHFTKPYDSILFVGCGPGYEVRHWREVGKRAFGVDVSEFAIGWIRENAPDIQEFCHLTDGVHLPFANDSIDVLASFDCLVLCPAEVRPDLIAEMCRVAKSQIVVRTRPQMGQPLLLQDEKGEWWSESDGVLFRYETMEYWIAQFEKSGKFRLDGWDNYPGDALTHVFKFERKV